jgi:hypothetical protein
VLALSSRQRRLRLRAISCELRSTAGGQLAPGGQTRVPTLVSSFALPTTSSSFGSAVDGTDADATSSSCGNAPCSTDCRMASPSFSADTCEDMEAIVHLACRGNNQVVGPEMLVWQSRRGRGIRNLVRAHDDLQFPCPATAGITTPPLRRILRDRGFVLQWTTTSGYTH